jgi:hypothetical protein
MRLMKIKNLVLGLALAVGAFAQNSVLGTITTFNLAGVALDNQQIQAAIGATQPTAEEGHATAERMRLETERIRLANLRESQAAQQTAADGKLAADMENQVKAPEAQLAEARTQVRIEHLKLLAMKAREKHSDFDETMRHLNLPTSHAMAEAILDSELAAEIMYWLGKHPTECKLIGDLQPLSAVREIGRIEGTIAPLAP